MCTRLIRACRIAGLVVAVAALARAAEALAQIPGGDGGIVVTVHPTATVASAQLAVGDVASVDGGSVGQRQKISRLDLADNLRPGGEMQISSNQIDYRIQIAGFEPSLFRVQGAPHVRVNRMGQESAPPAGSGSAAPPSGSPIAENGVPAPPGEGARRRLTEEDVVNAARQLVLKRLPWDPQDITIELAQPVGSLPALELKGDVRLEAELHSQTAPLGRVQVSVAIVADGKQSGLVPVNLAVKLYQKLAVARRRIEASEPLGPDSVSFDRRPVDDPSRDLTATDGLAGKRAKHLLAAGQVIGHDDVDVFVTEIPPLVRRGELVRLVAHVGPLEVKTKGEALQDGRTDQLVRIRNIESGAIVLGRVVDHSVVQVDY